MKKYYRFVNTEAGELPVVGDEILIPALEIWNRINDESALEQAKYQMREQTVIRRELHPQEMAKEIAGELIKEYAPSTVYLKYEDRLKSRMITDRELTEFLIPHIQAALEGKG
jgi:hypothetical protein